jgi:hypothetical protein
VCFLWDGYCAGSGGMKGRALREPALVASLPEPASGLGPAGDDPAREVAQWARETQREVADGRRDLRDLGRAMNGRWDQDFPATALAILASCGEV